MTDDTLVNLTPRKIIDDLYIHGPEGTYKFILPTQTLHDNGGDDVNVVYDIRSHEAMLLTIMMFKALTNKSGQPLDFWEYINRNNLGRFFEKIEDEPS